MDRYSYYDNAASDEDDVRQSDDYEFLDNINITAGNTAANRRVSDIENNNKELVENSASDMSTQLQLLPVQRDLTQPHPFIQFPQQLQQQQLQQQQLQQQNQQQQQQQKQQQLKLQQYQPQQQQLQQYQPQQQQQLQQYQPQQQQLQQQQQYQPQQPVNLHQQMMTDISHSMMSMEQNMKRMQKQMEEQFRAMSMGTPMAPTMVMPQFDNFGTFARIKAPFNNDDGGGLLSIAGPSSPGSSTLGPSSLSSVSPPSPSPSSSTATDDPYYIDHNGKKHLKMQFDMQDFKPEEVQVKKERNRLEVSALHEEKEPNRVSCRVFHQQYHLPKDIRLTKVDSKFSPDGTLTVESAVKPRHRVKFVEDGSPQLAIEEPPRATNGRHDNVVASSYSNGVNGTPPFPINVQESPRKQKESRQKQASEVRFNEDYNQDTRGFSQDSPGYNHDSRGYNQDSRGYNQDSRGYNHDSLGYKHDSRNYNTEPRNFKPEVRSQDPRGYGQESRSGFMTEPRRSYTPEAGSSFDEGHSRHRGRELTPEDDYEWPDLQSRDQHKKSRDMRDERSGQMDYQLMTKSLDRRPSSNQRLKDYQQEDAFINRGQNNSRLAEGVAQVYVSNSPSYDQSSERRYNDARGYATLARSSPQKDAENVPPKPPKRSSSRYNTLPNRKLGSISEGHRMNDGYSSLKRPPPPNYHQLSYLQQNGDVSPASSSSGSTVATAYNTYYQPPGHKYNTLGHIRK